MLSEVRERGQPSAVVRFAASSPKTSSPVPGPPCARVWNQTRHRVLIEIGVADRATRAVGSKVRALRLCNISINARGNSSARMSINRKRTFIGACRPAISRHVQRKNRSKAKSN